MNTFAISLGSNSKDRSIQMNDAIQYLNSIFVDVLCSTIYETQALNGKDAPYLNAVAVANTHLSIVEATKLLKEWEIQCGRTTESKLIGSIPIDLDIVVWNGEVVREKDFSCDFFTQGYLQLVPSGNEDLF